MIGDGIFCDTSGFLALLNADDDFHMQAAEFWRNLGTRHLFTSDYVRLETCSLIQRRLGSKALLDLCDKILVMIDILPVGEEGFERAVSTWRLARRRQLSLVDITSFDCMRKHGIQQAFAFDGHFREEGFVCFCS
jgi:uncharacterized protein